MTEKRLRFATWAAVSSEEQAKSDKDSLPTQREATIAKVKALGGEVVAELTVEESRELLDFTTACATIDAYSQLKRLVDARSIDVLVFLNRGRLGRTAAVVESLALYLLRNDVALYDLSSPPSSIVASEQLHSSGDQLNGVIQSWRYQNEMTELRRRHKFGMVGRIKRGLLPGNMPYAYIKVFDDRGKVKSYKVDEDKADTVRLIFSLYAIGTQYETILDKLRGRVSPSGKQFTVGSVKRILDRVWVYASYIEYNKRGEREFIRVKSDILPPIIDESLLQRVVSEQARRAIGEIVQGALLYSGIVFCVRCARRMGCITHAGRSRRKDGSLYSQPIVRCDGCKRSVTWRRLDRELLAWFASLPQEYPAPDVSNTTSLDAEASRVQGQLDKLVQSKARAYSAYVDNLVDREQWQAEVKRLEGHRKELTDTLQALRLQIAQQARKQPTAKRYAHVLSVGVAMLELGKAEPRKVNAWLREYIHIEFNENSKLVITAT